MFLTLRARVCVSVQREAAQLIWMPAARHDNCKQKTNPPSRLGPRAHMPDQRAACGVLGWAIVEASRASSGQMPGLLSRATCASHSWAPACTISFYALKPWWGYAQYINNMSDIHISPRFANARVNIERNVCVS